MQKCGYFHPLTRIPNSSVRHVFFPSVTFFVTKKPGCNISGTESRIIKPLVAKRPGKKSEIKNTKKNEKMKQIIKNEKNETKVKKK